MQPREEVDEKAKEEKKGEEEKVRTKEDVLPFEILEKEKPDVVALENANELN